MLRAMGNWQISIRGTGAHHNEDNPDDANVMAARFTAELMEAGHIVTDATFTHGGVELLGTNAHHSGCSEIKPDPTGATFTLRDGSRLWISAADLRLAAGGAPEPAPPTSPPET